MEQKLFGNKNILVTGATGIVGAHLCIELAKQSCNVIAVARNEISRKRAEHVFEMYGVAETIAPYITWKYADITQYDEVCSVVAEADYVFNCAGYVSFNNAEKKQLIDVNVTSVAHIVNACLEYKLTKLCHVSSVSALGKPYDSVEITEDCDYNESKISSVYGYSKHLGELEVWRGIAEGLPAVIVNPTVIIAPGFWNQSSGALFSTIARGLPFYTHGVTGYVGVNDVVKSMLDLMKSNISGERFIVNSQNVSYKSVFTSIAQSISVPPPRYYAPYFLMLVAGFFAQMFLRTSNLSVHTAKTAHSVSKYSSQKLKDAISIRFRNIHDDIRETGAFFCKDVNAS